MIPGFIEVTRLHCGSILISIASINAILIGNEGAIICLNYDEYWVSETYDQVKAMIAEQRQPRLVSSSAKHPNNFIEGV
jgi:hypothetical protein